MSPCQQKFRCSMLRLKFFIEDTFKKELSCVSFLKHALFSLVKIPLSVLYVYAS